VVCLFAGFYATHLLWAMGHNLRISLLPALVASAFLFLLAPWPTRAQLSTEEHLSQEPFWPTETFSPRDAYAPAATCQSCHSKIWATQKTTPMANAAEPINESGILHSHTKTNFSVSHFHYEIKTGATGSRYVVTDGKHTMDYPLLWAFGVGRVGQSYLFKKEDGNIYEARVSFFEVPKTLGFTPGRALAAPKDVDEAMNRRVGPAEVRKCFSCHTTASIFNGSLDEKNMIPGVRCQACHGPGAKHASAMQAAQLAGTSDPGATAIFNPESLPPADSVDFCGACHGTFWDIQLSKITGVSTVRSQPYRLESSKCWAKADARLTCVACHDPHLPLETESSSYDHVCLSCHINTLGAKTTADHPGAACPTATKDCSSCHMPKVFVPEMHADFTDHRIRIAKKGEPYPE
jgi:Cytochrome c554 and c-prime